MKICTACQESYPDDFALCPRDGTPLAASARETEAQLAAGLSRRFRIIRRLGAGGMGTVFLAEQIGVGNRPVALKVLNRKLLDDADFLQRFQNEAGSTGRIRHANVVTIFESAQADDGTPYIAMEFLEGESLRQVLQQRGALPLTEVAEILLQVARGLNAAHKLGIIHRDLKPDNIFLTRGDEGERIAKVVDFGIAKLRESANHTQTGMVLGTPAYMSCEQASGMRSDDLDARSDVYSLGVMVYEMLTGRVPFHSDTPLGYLRKHMLDEPPPLRAIAPGLGVPPAVESAVMKALAKNRNQRYAAALDFARAFAAAAQDAPAAEFSPPLPSTKIVLAPPPRKNADAPRPPRPSGYPAAAPSLPSGVPEAPQFQTASKPSNRLKLIAAALVTVLLMVAAAWYFSPSRHPLNSPPAPVEAPQAGAGRQPPSVDAPLSPPKDSFKTGADAAARRKQIAAALTQGNSYYENGDYNNAIRVYQEGLKLDPSNAQLLAVLKRAKTAQKTEASTN